MNYINKLYIAIDIIKVISACSEYSGWDSVTKSIAPKMVLTKRPSEVGSGR